MIKKIDPTKFTYRKYNAGGWVDLGYNFADRCNINIFRENIKKYAIGYCDSSNLTIRSKIGKAVMFNMQDGEENFWLHLEDWEFEKIFNE
jgi:hypothetical protein